MQEYFILRRASVIEINTVFSYLTHRNVFLFPLKSLITHMEYLDSKNAMQIFTQRGNVCTWDVHGRGPLACGEMVNHTAVRLHSSLASLPHKEHPQDQPITNGGEEGDFSKSRLYRRVCDGPTCTCLFMIQFLFHTVSLIQNHLKASSLSIHDFTSLTPILLYLFSSSSWFNSSIFSFCIPSTTARARWRFPSASVTYCSKKRAQDTKVSHACSSTKLSKKGSELENRKFWWSISEDAVIRAYFPKSLGCRDQDNKNCSVSRSCKWSMLQSLSDLTLLETPPLIRVKNLKPEKFWKSGQRLPVQFSPSHEAREIFQISINSFVTDNYWKTQCTRRMSACSWFPNFSCISDRQVWPTTQCHPCSQVAHLALKAWVKNLGEQQMMKNHILTNSISTNLFKHFNT